MHPRIRRMLSAIAVVAAASAINCARAPVAPSPQAQIYRGTLQPGFFGPTHEFSAESVGVATMTLTWTEPRADLNVQLTESRCGVLCQVLSSSQGQRGPVRQVSWSVREGERYSIDIVNETTAIGTSYVLEVVVR